MECGSKYGGKILGQVITATSRNQRQPYSRLLHLGICILYRTSTGKEQWPECRRIDGDLVDLSLALYQSPARLVY